MKPNTSKKYTIILLIIGGIMIYAFYRCSQPVKEIIKEKQRIHLFGTFK